MAGFWNELDLLLRRNPRLPRFEMLRAMLRRPYHWLMSLGGGLPLNIGGVLPVRLPARYLAKEQEFYEAENYAAFREWTDSHNGGWVIDVGCSLGYFTCAALFQSSVCGVVAIDADQESLGICQRVCQFAPDVSRRLTLLNCLITDSISTPAALAEIQRITRLVLGDGRLTGDPAKINYVNADTGISQEQLPRVSIDSLAAACLPEGCRLLIKVDVEGAEEMVLAGASETLSHRRPTLLLSVHPGYLPRFGSDSDRIGALLQNAGYSWRVLAVDHEEHWLCEPQPS